jgi:eukaryotic-like serine/threonine-protein kinase
MVQETGVKDTGVQEPGAPPHPDRPVPEETVPGVGAASASLPPAPEDDPPAPTRAALRFGRDALTRSRAMPHESVHALDIAARSVLESQVLEGTVASLADQRALDHHYRGLLQFAALRVGGAAARSVVAELEQQLDDVLADHATPLSVKARLYRRLRLRLADVPVGGPPPVYWGPEDPAYRNELERARHELKGFVREVAELAFARRLAPHEVAYVLAAHRDMVESAIEEARTRATALFGARTRSADGTRESALAETFALDFRRSGLDTRRERLPVLADGMVVGERYEIETRIGAGTFADVYRARDKDVPDHVVALKILRHRARDDAAERRALRELQLIASVFHPSVVQLKDHGWYDGRLWFVMPLYRGETLAQRLARGPLSRRRAREIFEPLAEALATMHRAGVRHQDVKPENIFLARLATDEPTSDRSDGDGPVLPILLDLGVAAKDAELVLAGTPLYFAPEVAARFAGVPDPAPVGPKADVFSLALSLVHALDPSERDGLPSLAVDAFVAMRARKSPPAPRSKALADLAPTLTRWLAGSPDQRPSAEELHHELRVLTLPEERRARRLSTLRWLAPSVVAVAALFSAMVYVLSHEASLQRAEAALARAQAERAGRKAESIYESLTAEEAKRRALEANVRGLEQDKERSRMTRDELTEQLARSDAERERLLESERSLLARLQKESDSLREAREQLSAVSGANTALVQQRAQALSELERRESQRAELESELNKTHTRIAAVERELADTQKRADAFEAKLNATKAPFGIPRAP